MILRSRIALLFALLAGASALASAQGGLAMAPAIFDLKFQPGKPVEFDITIVNETERAVQMQGTIQDWWYNDKNERVFGAPGTYPRSASNWIEFVPRQFEVTPKNSRKVHVVVTPPPEASNGGHYAVIFIESRPQLVQPATAEHRALFANVRLGALVMLTQEKTEDYQIEVTEAKLTPPGEARNLRLDFVLANRSNTHILPMAKLGVIDANHKLLGRAEADVRRFLPEQRDTMTVARPQALPKGDYTAVLTFVYGDNRLYTQEFPFRVP